MKGRVVFDNLLEDVDFPQKKCLRVADAARSQALTVAWDAQPMLVDVPDVDLSRAAAPGTSWPD